MHLLPTLSSRASCRARMRLGPSTRMPRKGTLSPAGVTAATVRGASVGLDRGISMFIPMMHLGSSRPGHFHVHTHDAPGQQSTGSFPCSYPWCTWAAVRPWAPELSAQCPLQILKWVKLFIYFFKSTQGSTTTKPTFNLLPDTQGSSQPGLVQANRHILLSLTQQMTLNGTVLEKSRLGKVTVYSRPYFQVQCMISSGAEL